MDTEKESFDLTKLALTQYFYIATGGPYNYETREIRKFLNLFINANWSISNEHITCYYVFMDMPLDL